MAFVNKQNISYVQIQKSLFAEKSIINLKAGSRHTFNYGILNISPCVAAIQSKKGLKHLNQQ